MSENVAKWSGVEVRNPYLSCAGPLLTYIRLGTVHNRRFNLIVPTLGTLLTTANIGRFKSKPYRQWLLSSVSLLSAPMSKLLTRTYQNSWNMTRQILKNNINILQMLNSKVLHIVWLLLRTCIMKEGDYNLPLWRRRPITLIWRTRAVASPQASWLKILLVKMQRHLRNR